MKNYIVATSYQTNCSSFSPTSIRTCSLGDADSSIHDALSIADSSIHDAPSLVTRLGLGMQAVLSTLRNSNCNFPYPTAELILEEIDGRAEMANRGTLRQTAR